MNEQNPEYVERYGFDELREERRYLPEMRIANSMWGLVDPELDVVELDEPERCMAFYDIPMNVAWFFYGNKWARP